MTTIYSQRLEQVISGICSDIKGELNLEDEDSERAIWVPLKKALEASIEKNVNQHLKVLIQSGGTVASSVPDDSKHSKTVSTGKTSRTNGRIIAWNKWQEEGNDAKQKYKDKDGSEITAWDWWNKNVWKSMPEADKDKYTKEAEKLNEESKTSGTSNDKKESRTKNAFQLFQLKHAHHYSDGDKFHEPISNQQVSGWTLCQKIWAQAIKKGNPLNTEKNGRQYWEEYEKMAKKLKDGSEDFSDDTTLKQLPRINFDIVRSDTWKYEDIKLD